MEFAKYIDEYNIEKAPKVKNGCYFNYNSETNKDKLLEDGYLPVEISAIPEKSKFAGYLKKDGKIISTFETLTLEEQNETIRATRESLYVQTSDKLKADYDEAVARGAENVEELKKAWLDSKDKIRAENPYVGGDDNGLQGQETKVRTYTYE